MILKRVFIAKCRSVMSHNLRLMDLLRDPAWRERWVPTWDKYEWFTNMLFSFQEEDLPPEMPVTHDSMRLIDQAKAICEQRIYLDEAKELYSLISSKWMRNVLEIHDQLAAQIANSREEVEYIDGVSSIEEEDDDDARSGHLLFTLNSAATPLF